VREYGFGSARQGSAARALRGVQVFGIRCELPVAAVTAAAAPPAATTAASAVTTAPTTAASAMTTAATATTTAAFTLRTRFVDDERAAEKFAPIESCDDLFGFSVIPNFGESETARLAREPVAKQRERIRLYARFGK
jgi:hypothetical protein